MWSSRRAGLHNQAASLPTWEPKSGSDPGSLPQGSSEWWQSEAQIQGSIGPPCQDQAIQGGRRGWVTPLRQQLPSTSWTNKAFGDLHGQGQERRLTHLRQNSGQPLRRPAAPEAPDTQSKTSCRWCSWNGRFLFCRQPRDPWLTRATGISSKASRRPSSWLKSGGALPKTCTNSGL